jgi:hypothetical protein
MKNKPKAWRGARGGNGRPDAGCQRKAAIREAKRARFGVLAERLYRPNIIAQTGIMHFI